MLGNKHSYKLCYFSIHADIKIVRCCGDGGCGGGGRRVCFHWMQLNVF